MKCPNCLIDLRQNGTILQCAECGFNTPPNKKMMTDLFAWLSVDNVTRHEGIISMSMPPLNIPMPLVNSELETILRVQPEVKRIVKTMNISAKLVKFSRVEVIKEI